MPFSLRCVQYNDKYTTRLVDEEEPGRIRPMQRSQGRFPYAVIDPACDGINVYLNLDDTLKNAF